MIEQVIEVIKSIHEEIHDLYRVIFNLLEVLTQKRILGDEDIKYIRENNRKADE
jgi:hypothetical protein